MATRTTTVLTAVTTGCLVAAGIGLAVARDSPTDSVDPAVAEQVEDLAIRVTDLVRDAYGVAALRERPDAPGGLDDAVAALRATPGGEADLASEIEALVRESVLQVAAVRVERDGSPDIVVREDGGLQVTLHLRIERHLVEDDVHSIAIVPHEVTVDPAGALTTFWVQDLKHELVDAAERRAS